MDVKYICNDCNHVFDEPKIEHDNSKDFWGFSAEDELPVCPKCGSTNISEARKCKLCGKYEPEDEMLYNVVCDDCLDAISHDYNKCKSYATEGYVNESTYVAVNDLAYFILGNEEEVNKALFAYIEQNNIPTSEGCEEFVESYKEGIASQIFDEV